MDTINLYDAIQRMRQLTKANVPFSFSYIKCNESKGISGGVKNVDRALLRTGMSQEHSDKSEILIGYTTEPNGDNRWFYLPLLVMFNAIKVRP